MISSQHHAELGTLLRRYGAGLGVWLNLVLSVCFLFAGALGCIYLSFGSSPSAKGGQLFLSSTSLAIGVALFSAWVWQRPRTVQLYEHGLSYTYHTHSLTTRWEDVHAVWHQSIRYSIYFIPIGTAHTYILQTQTGESLKLTGSIGRVSHLGRAIQQATLPYLLNTALQQLRNGTTIPFGKLAIYQHGVGNGSTILPWNEISGIAIKRGYLQIKRTGERRPWMRVPIATTPNTHMLMALLQRQGAM